MSIGPNGPNRISQWQAILDRSARDYIARFPVGRGALEQVLLRRVNKHQFAENDPAQDAAKTALTKVLDDLEQEGAFSATARLTKERGSLIKRGRSPRVAMRKLAEKGHPGMHSMILERLTRKSNSRPR